MTVYHPKLPSSRTAHPSHSAEVIPFDLVRRPEPKTGERPHPVKTPPAMRLGHVHMKVRDLERSLPFYQRVLGLRLTERFGRMAFLAFGEEHHSLALEEIGAMGSIPDRAALGAAHIAFELADTEALASLRRILRAHRVPLKARNNGVSWTLRFHDPDGYELEAYLDRRRAPGGTPLWEGRWHKPFPIADDPVESLTPA